MFDTISPRLVAASWTSAGAVAPLDADERSPIPIQDRVAAVAATGWAGMGVAQADVAHIRDTIGFPAFRELLDNAGLTHVEYEFLNDWWLEDPDGSAWRERWSLLLDAGEATDAAFIKVGTRFDGPEDDLDYLVAPLRRLGTEAAARGQRVVLEPIAFSAVSTIPRGADLVRATGLDNVGICIDFWHVFRAGTTAEEVAAALSPGIVFAVEMNDCDREHGDDLFQDTVDNRRLCGEGEFDVQSLVDAISASGFTGPWGVEMLSTEYRQMPLRSALAAAHQTATAFLH